MFKKVIVHYLFMSNRINSQQCYWHKRMIYPADFATLTKKSPVLLKTCLIDLIYQGMHQLSLRKKEQSNCVVRLQKLLIALDEYSLVKQFYD